MPFSDNIKIEASDIAIRNDAPDELRGFLFTEIQNYNKGLNNIRQILCSATLSAPDPSNWGENNFMKEEIREKLISCQWFFVYDFIEQFAASLNMSEKLQFERNINKYFIINGIGWSLKDGQILHRGEKSFDMILTETQETLEISKQNTSANEIKEALTDISRRPEPDLTGAVQHSVAALECLARNITGKQNVTLGALISQFPNIVPEPLNIVISKLFGFASVKGRHLQEGVEPTQKEAELVVHLSAALCNYLAKTNLL